MKTTAIILAAGTGERMQLNENKVLLNLDRPILNQTLDKFDINDGITDIIIVIKQEEKEKILPLLKSYQKDIKLVYGGSTRQQSSYNGVMQSNSDLTLIHDAARPFVTQEIIKASIADAREHGVSVVGINATNTIKQTKDKFVVKTLDRDNLFITQTPQTFKSKIIKDVHLQARRDNLTVTDDVSLAEHYGHKVKVTIGSYRNTKITTQQDLPFKVGIGHDSHQYEPGASLTLAGITIPYDKTFKANSDGDVILHSLFNAITSSIGKKSIGHYADRMCKDGITDSSKYLKVALSLLQDHGYKLNNISISIEAKHPKLDQHLQKMKESIAKLIYLNPNNIGITATTGEDLTNFGKGLGMQAFSQVSVIKC